MSLPTRAFYILLSLLFSASASALMITGYSSTANDRFESGFPNAPVKNPDNSFVGAGRDWSGVAWTLGFVRKGYAFLSPNHYLVARHFGGASTIQSFDQTGTLQTQSQSSVQSIGYGIVLNAGQPGDLSIGTLANPMESVKRYPILDLHSTSSANDGNYNGSPLLVYGHGGNESSSTRLGASIYLNNTVFSNTGEYFLTSRTTIQLEDKDSGSPAFADWNNPNGTDEPALLGNHAAINETLGYNIHSFVGTAEIMSALNNFMNDEGRALRVVGNPAHTWSGSSSTDVNRNIAWGIGGNPNATGETEDLYVLFDPTTASSNTVNVNANYNLRGIYFRSSVSDGDHLAFSGSNTLTIGRGGITNYDADQQIFNAPLALGAPQYWCGGPGGLSIGSIQTNGQLVEIDTTGDSIISGAITGSGGLALETGKLTLTGISSFTGGTWAHSGTLHINGKIDSSSHIEIGTLGTLSGTGSVPTILGSGNISPGNSPGILTVESVDPSSGLDFDFEFTAASAPLFSNATASINDVLRITDGTPFASAADSNNTIRIYLDVGALSDGEIFKGGFYTDSSSDFISSITDATIEIYLADGSGGVSFGGQNYSLYEGPFLFNLSTVAQNADFGQGNVAGRIMQLELEPDLTKYEGWKISYSLTGNAALDTADDDLDGIGLLLEFALGGDPTQNDISISPTHSLTPDGNNTYLELNLTRPKDLQGLDYTPKTTTDLLSWPNDSTGIENPTPTPSDNGNGTETLTYRRASALDAADKAFIRVDVAESAP